MKNILVTGGAGFIGSNFVRMYHEKYNITVLDKFTYAANKINLLNTYHKLYIADITDEMECEAIIANGKFDAIINFAAESHVDNSIKDPNVFVETNILGTKNLLDLALKYGVGKFIQISTDEVYGHLDLDSPAFTEKTPVHPRSPYSATKAAADMLVMAYANTYGLNACITRCSNNYGPNQHREKLIPTIVSKAVYNESIPIYGTGGNIRDWIYVDDHCRGIDIVLEWGVSGEVYNFGGKSEITNLELCKFILNHLGKPESLISFVTDRAGHDFRYAIDFTKATNELGWTPEHSFEPTMKATITTEYIKNMTGNRDLL